MIEPVPIDRWLAFDAHHPAPTFFARPAWALALAHAFPNLHPNPVSVRVNGVALLVPLVRVAGGRFGWRDVVGMPLGAYTCALRPDGSVASAQEFAMAAVQIARATDACSLTPWPLAPNPAPFLGWKTREHETSVIDLSLGAERALARVDGVSRRMAGQAERRGVTCAPCRSGVAAGTYYGMLREASERWGLARPPFPRELLEGLMMYGGSDVEIWFAQCDGRPVAGGVVFYGSEELFFWSAAMRSQFTRFRPSNALNVALITAAAQRRVHWYNLGASEGLPGVERFKRGLGATVVPYAEARRERAAFNVYSRLRSTVRQVSARGGS